MYVVVMNRVFLSMGLKRSIDSQVSNNRHETKGDPVTRSLRGDETWHVVKPPHGTQRCIGGDGECCISREIIFSEREGLCLTMVIWCHGLNDTRPCDPISGPSSVQVSAVRVVVEAYRANWPHSGNECTWCWQQQLNLSLAKQ